MPTVRRLFTALSVLSLVVFIGLVAALAKAFVFDRFWQQTFASRPVIAWQIALLSAVIFLPFAAFPILSCLWLRRRDKVNRCKQCRYNLTGNTSGVCPECGTPTRPRN